MGGVEPVKRSGVVALATARVAARWVVLVQEPGVDLQRWLIDEPGRSVSVTRYRYRGNQIPSP